MIFINKDVSFIHGFSRGKFVYFLSVQKSTNQNSNQLVTKIARICAEDRYFHSYVEVPFQCTATGNAYTELNAASVANNFIEGDFEAGWEFHPMEARGSIPGAVLLQNSKQKDVPYDYSGSSDKDRLFAIFAGKDDSGRRSSVLCSVNLDDVDRTLSEITEGCWKGDRRLSKGGPEHYGFRRRCDRKVST